MEFFAQIHEAEGDSPLLAETTVACERRRARHLRLLGRHGAELRLNGVPAGAGPSSANGRRLETVRKDLANFELADAPSIVVGKAPDELPALKIQLTGMVTASNLKVFEESALQSSTQ